MSNNKKEENTFSRRKFLKTGAIAGGAAVVGLAVGLPSVLKLGKSNANLGTNPVSLVHASYFVPNQVGIDPSTIPKYVDPVPTFVGARVDAGRHPNLTINNEETQVKILPSSLYTGDFAKGTYVWGYSVDDGKATYGPLYPAFTIEAQRNVPVRVTYKNSLTNTNLQKYLTVDQTIHWANPNNEMFGSDARQLPYTGDVPVVTHLHGGEVQSTSDGGPDAWFLPGYTVRGPAWTYGGVTQYYTYPNKQEATTLFYHDHCLGATRINLYAGLVGFYFIRDQYDTGLPGKGLNLPAGPYELELLIQDKMLDTDGQLLFPDGTGSNSPYYLTHYLDATGAPLVPQSPAGFNGGPTNPNLDPFWIPEFFGDIMLVNGKSWPKLEVEPRRYRLRMVNGCNARFLHLYFADASDSTLANINVPIYIIGTDGGLLDAPAMVTDVLDAPAERLDVIIDFSAYAGKSLILANDANAPFPDGLPVNPETTAQIMKIIVKSSTTSTDTSFDPAATGAVLRNGAHKPPKIVRLADGIGGIAAGVKIDRKRMLVLKEFSPPGGGGPEIVMVNNTGWLGRRPDTNDPMTGTPIPGFNQLGPQFLSELPQVGSTEQWDIVNLTADAHPIHIHLVQFQLMNRQNFNLGVNFANGNTIPGGYFEYWSSLFPGGTFGGVTYPAGQFIPKYGPPLPYYTPNEAGYIGGNPDVGPWLQGSPSAPVNWEVGWKDTFKMFPNQVTRVIVRWAPQDTAIGSVKAGQNKYAFDSTAGPGYVWHCHIVDHEDNEMMRPYTPKK